MSLLSWSLPLAVCPSHGHGVAECGQARAPGSPVPEQLATPQRWRSAVGMVGTSFVPAQTLATRWRGLPIQSPRPPPHMPIPVTLSPVAASTPHQGLAQTPGNVPDLRGDPGPKAFNSTVPQPHRLPPAAFWQGGLVRGLYPCSQLLLGLAVAPLLSQGPPWPRPGLRRLLAKGLHTALSLH